MEDKSMATILFFFFLSTILLSLSSPLAAAAAPGSPVPAAAPHNISAIISFGDSTLDPGNNDAASLFVRADHMPYGRDFPGQVPTGRFSNGKLITDFMVSSLGLKDVLPAYLDPRLTPRDLVTGVSFASAGSGLDELTAMTSGVLAMDTQIAYFRDYLRKLQAALGSEAAAAQTVADAIFVIGVGSNDMMINYYMLPTRKLTYTLTRYQDFLLQKLESFVQQLYSMGARKITISGLPPLGCVPFQITGAANTPGSNMDQRACVDQQNEDSVAYNSNLQALIPKMQASLEGAKIAYVDTYNPLMDMIKNPQKYGFVEVTRGCCGTGLMEMGPTCMPSPSQCPDPSKFLFWDSVHPSQAAYQTLAEELMKTVLPQITG